MPQTLVLRRTAGNRRVLSDQPYPRLCAALSYGAIGNDGDLHILREIHDLLNESFRQPASQRSLLVPKDEDLRDPLLPREGHERFR
jgi:hypothetical protein